MIRRHLMALRLGLMALDGATAVATFLLVSLIRFGDGEWREVWIRLGLDIQVIGVVFGVSWVVALRSQDLYQLRTRWQLRSELVAVARATVLVATFALSALFLGKGESVSRLFLLVLLVAQPTVTIIGRGLIRGLFGLVRERGHNTRYMLIVGAGQLSQRFADRLESQRQLGITVIGHLSMPNKAPGDITRPILGSLDDIEALFHSRVIDEVAVCVPQASATYVEPVVRLAAAEGKVVRVVVDPDRDAPPGSIREEFEGFVVRSTVTDSGHEVSLAAKRILDIVAAGAGLVLLSPILLVAAVLIRWRDGAPVLFRQTRIGLHGREFTIYKFRSMAFDAESRLHEVAHLNERNGAAFKASNDPRITPLGRTLRKWSIDELPQLWNVLNGTMSLVGPRPPLPHEVRDYDIWHRRRLSMKPGITGLWQVEARRDPDFDHWVERDLRYIDRWSLLLDLRILLRTVPAVLQGGR